MLRFKEFITETFLIEGRIDDLKAQNPGLHHQIDQYAAADTTPTKKFVPWLVSQHKRGNVTPDHPDLHAVVQNFDRYKARHGIQDHSSKSFQDVHAAVMPLIGAGATKREVAHKGRLKIHDTGDIQAYHVQTKEASQHFYGGGPEAGPTNTTWCVAARSPDCLFEKQYGKMYTIHAKNDPNSPYAVHPENNIITTRHNDGDEDIDEQLKNNASIAKLKPAIDAIQKHYNPFAYRLRTASNITHDEIDKAMNDPNLKRYVLQNPNPHIAIAGLNHPEADVNSTWSAAWHPHSDVAMAALNHPLSDSYVNRIVVRHPDPHVALAAMNHDNTDYWAIHNAVQHPDTHVALAALKHSFTDNGILQKAAEHPHPQVALAALNHPLSNISTVSMAVYHKDPQVALTALNHHSADSYSAAIAAGHPNAEVALAALNHPLVSHEAIHNALLEHSNKQVVLAALNHPLTDSDILWHIVKHPDSQVALAALKHEKVDDNVLWTAVQHPDSKVAIAAINHPKVETSVLNAAVEHPDPDVAIAALKHPKANKKTGEIGADHPNQKVWPAADAILTKLNNA